MDREKVEQANEIIEELDELKSYKEMIHDGNHFRFIEHYLGTADFIDIPKKYTSRLTSVLDEIIEELEQKLEDL